VERDLQLALGKILGETYRTQKTQGICEVSDGTIYGLLNGFQEAIDSELGNLDYIEEFEISLVSDYLTPYWNGEKELSELPSFLDFRISLEREGIKHGRLITILTYLRATGRFTTEIDKLGNFKLKRGLEVLK
jgi:hypothetical protein